MLISVRMSSSTKLIFCLLLCTGVHLAESPGPRAPTLPTPQSVTIGQLSNGVHALMEYTFTTNFHIWGQGPPGAPGPDSPPLTMCYDWVSEIPTPIYRNSRGLSERISNDTPAKLPQLMRTDFTTKRTTLNRFAVKSVLISRGSLSRLPFGIRRNEPQEFRWIVVDIRADIR